MNSVKEKTIEQYPWWMLMQNSQQNTNISNPITLQNVVQGQMRANSWIYG